LASDAEAVVEAPNFLCQLGFVKGNSWVSNPDVVEPPLAFKE
jgi:hypothetical protein